MFQGFQPIGEISSHATRAVAIRTLTNHEQRLYDYLQKRLWSSKRIPRALNMHQIAFTLDLSYWNVRKAKNGLKKKGLIETWTTTHQNPSRGRGSFTSTSYYRVKF